MRLSPIVAVAAAAFLTACAQTAGTLPAVTAASCRTANAQNLSSGLQSALPDFAQDSTLMPAVATAAKRRLWPREGPAVRVCGDVGAGFARCLAWLRTDIHGPIQPDTPGGYAPSDLQTAYGLTSESARKGAGQTVAIVDAYDDPNADGDLATYRRQFGLPACSVAGGCFTVQKYTVQTNPGWAAEESVDLDMVSAVCPHCKILLVEAASTSIADLSTAEKYATAHADVVSNSWGGSEGTTAYDDAFSGRCVPITAATGDKGYTSTAQWPAILPSVVAVGGTSLSSISPRVETAWTNAGSGCSKLYAKPRVQSDLKTGCAMRAESDVSADADPRTGVAVYDSFHQSGWLVFGGTSVAAPIVASLFALVGDGAANRTTTPIETLYSHVTALNDVTSGSNGGCGPPLCVAGPGWNGPTGLGTPNGVAAF